MDWNVWFTCAVKNELLILYPNVLPSHWTQSWPQDWPSGQGQPLQNHPGPTDRSAHSPQTEVRKVHGAKPHMVQFQPGETPLGQGKGRKEP